MLSDRLKQLARRYIAARQAQARGESTGGSPLPELDALDQFVSQLKAEGIHYQDNNDAARIAVGIANGTYSVRYHSCGQAVIRDGGMVRIYGGKLAGRAIEKCPGCGLPLNGFNLYAVSGGAARDMLQEAGLYPTTDGLTLIKDAEQRANILQEIRSSLSRLSDSDLLAIYAVVTTLLQEDVAD